MRTALSAGKLAAAMVALTIGVATVPADAATTTRALYFADTGGTRVSVCEPHLELVSRATTTQNCASLQVGYQGQPSRTLATEVFEGRRSALGWRLDTRRKLTGVVYLKNQTPYGVAASNPGPAGAEIDIYVNNSLVGTVTKDALQISTSPLRIPVNMTLPSRLNGVVVTTLTVDVVHRGGLGLVYVGHDADSQSLLRVPVR